MDNCSSYVVSPHNKHFITAFLLIAVLVTLTACTGPTPTHTAPTSPTTTINVTDQVAGEQFVRKILDSLQGSSGWTPPLPPTGGQKPRALTKEELDRGLEIASAVPQVVEAKRDKDVVSVDTKYLWVGWNGNPDGESFLNYEAVENGTANLSNKDDTWYPGVSFLFNSKFGEYGKAGIQVAVNLQTGKVVWLGGYTSFPIPPKFPLPSPTPTASVIPPWGNLSIFTDEATMINVEVGEEFIIRYDYYHNLFPIFEINDEPSNIVALLDRKEINTPEPQIGDGVEWFLLKAINVGNTNITIKEFTHQSSVIQSQKTFRINVVTSASSPSPSQTAQPTFTPFPEPPRITRLVGDDDKKLTEIVLSDSRIQELIKDKSYDFVVNNQQIKGEDWNLSVGVILKEGLTKEERQRFIQQSNAGRTDHSLIAKYMGILVIGDRAIAMPGYIDIYDILINYEQAKVESITLEPRSDMQIPQLTLSERKQAVTIALNDARLQEILKDKTYKVAPTGVHVAFDKYLNKEGADFEIWLGGSHSIDVSGTGQYQQGSVLVVMVNLATEKVSIRVQGGPS